MIGTIINTATVILGSAIGLAFKKRVPEKAINVVFQGIGLFTICIGISMFLKSQQLLVVVLSILIGGITGGLLQLDKKIENFSEKLKKKVSIIDKRFTEAVVTSFLLFCTGAMTILGAIDEGLGNGSELLITKSIIDGFASIALASALGIGVLFSSVPLFLFQAAITLTALFFGNFFDAAIINEMTATGGVLLCGLGLNLLNVTKIKTVDLLPAIIYAVLFAHIFNSFIN